MEEHGSLQEGEQSGDVDDDDDDDDEDNDDQVTLSGMENNLSEVIHRKASDQGESCFSG